LEQCSACPSRPPSASTPPRFRRNPREVGRSGAHFAQLIPPTVRSGTGEVGRIAQSAGHCIVPPRRMHCRVPAHAGATTSRMTTRVACRPPDRIPSAHRQERVGQLANHCLRDRTCRIDPFVHEHEIEDLPPRPRSPFCRRPRFSFAPTVIA
jgi:hypothetical protein